MPLEETIFQASSVLHTSPNLLADCDGGDKELKPYQVPYDFYSFGVGCGQCQVVIPDPWFDQLNRQPEVEKNRLLRGNNPTTSNSRLACCVQVRPEMNEMICVVANNQSHNGEINTGFDPAAF